MIHGAKRTPFLSLGLSFRLAYEGKETSWPGGEYALYYCENDVTMVLEVPPPSTTPSKTGSEITEAITTMVSDLPYSSLHSSLVSMYRRHYY